jgi:hypothetical protein
MLHRASAEFWQEYKKLSQGIRARADKQFSLLKIIPRILHCNSRSSGIATARKSGQSA